MYFLWLLSCCITISCLFGGSNGEGQCMAKHGLRMTAQLYSCDFEVFGRVQGVFFRKYTQKRAIELGLKGWCMNTRDDTVKGVMEGEEKGVNEMKHWLANTGSPSSKIDRAVFGTIKSIAAYSFTNFRIVQ